MKSSYRFSSPSLSCQDRKLARDHPKKNYQSVKKLASLMEKFYQSLPCKKETRQSLKILQNIALTCLAFSKNSQL